MKKILFSILFSALASLSLQAQGQKLDEIIAIVGTDIILESDLNSQIKLLESQGTSVNLEMRAMILDQLLSNALMVAVAEKDSVEVDEDMVYDQVQAKITMIEDYMSKEQFIEYYGMRPSEMKEMMFEPMRKQMLTQQMQQQIFGEITITPKEVKTFFNSIPTDSLPYFNSEVELAELVALPKVNPIEDRKAFELAKELRARLMEDSADFAQLAMKYSQDPGSAARGGELGVVKRGSFVPEFEAAAYQLDKNEISEVVKSDFGYHIIQLNERLGNKIDSRHILITAEIKQADRDLAIARLDSIRQLILLDSFTFDQAIQKFSEDELSKNQAGTQINPATGQPFFELGDLEPEVYFAIDQLKIGEISEPIEYKSMRGATQYKIVKVRNKTQPHAANLKDDYSKIVNAALEAKKGKALSDWVTKKIGDNYIYFSPKFLSEEKDFIKAHKILQKWIDVAKSGF